MHTKRQTHNTETHILRHRSAHTHTTDTDTCAHRRALAHTDTETHIETHRDT